ncbi:MAG: hypothetical protein CMI52_03620 [Parcubacteria group bacterium]|nr:hypothetical protein [Parcubacteria group bacterium]
MMALKYTLIALIKDILYLPVWWYTRGTVFIYKWLVNTSVSTWKQMGLAVWIKNLFVPMFQQYDWQGRIISFFMRLVQIIGRFIGFVIMFAIYLVIFLAWFILPAFAVYLFLQTTFNTYTPLI